MKKIISIVSGLVILLLFTACGGSYVLSPAQEKMVGSDTTVYTQVGMWTEKNRAYGVNYARGLYLPVNTKVKILAVSGKAIAFSYLGAKITYYTHSKYTKIDSAKTMKRLFSSKKVNLAKYSKKSQASISIGEIKIGMTKDEVLLSRGYPPLNETLSLKSDYWVYRQHRFRRMGVTFTNNKVSNIK